MIGFLPKFQRNFELSGTSKLTVFELTVTDLYEDFAFWVSLRKNLEINIFVTEIQKKCLSRALISEEKNFDLPLVYDQVFS